MGGAQSPDAIGRYGAQSARATAGYRAFFANGFNVTRTLVLFCWEVVIERVAALQQRRRDVRPRGHRGGRYPLVRAALCVGVRDLIVFGVLTDMMRGRPAVYATFSSYDEVAHHSGLERADTLEALRKLDQQFGRIDGARRYAPRPYKLVVLSDHGQTRGATFKQRNGYDLHDLVEQSIEQATVTRPVSFHGGLGGPQTRPFLLHPVELPERPEPIVGAASVHQILTTWRQSLQREPVAASSPQGIG